MVAYAVDPMRKLRVGRVALQGKTYPPSELEYDELETWA